MNRKIFLERLCTALERFVLFPQVIAELVGLLKHSGQETAFLSILLTRLKTLSDEGVHATVHKEFELLSSGIYSMHLTGAGFNIRILYGFLPDQRPALLMAFYERAGHSATDYTGKISAALKRLHDLEEKLP